MQGEEQESLSRPGRAQSTGASIVESCGRSLRDPLELHDRQMLLPFVPCDFESDLGPRIAANSGWRRGARRAARPLGSRFKAWPPASGWRAAVSFVGRSPAQCSVWAEVVVPGRVIAGLDLEGLLPKRNDDSSEAFIFHRPDEALDDGDAAT